MPLTPEEARILNAGPDLNAYPITAMDAPRGLAAFFSEPNFTNNVLPALGVVAGRPDYTTAAEDKRYLLATRQSEIDSYAYGTLNQAYEDDKSFEIKRRDGMTGLLRRDAWLDQLQLSMDTAERTGGRVAVVLLDLDAFKIANKLLGQLGGDRVIEQIGIHLRQHVRDGYRLSGRLGGDEFGLILEFPPADTPDVGPRHRRRGPDSPEEGEAAEAAFARVTSIVDNVVATINESLAEYNVPRLAISAGAVLIRPGVALEDILVEADRLVKDSKQQNSEAVLARLAPEDKVEALTSMAFLIRLGVVDPRVLPFDETEFTETAEG